MKHDPIENDQKIKKRVQAAETEAEFSMEQDGTIDLDGSCHILWSRQKKILQDKYGIKWRSPADMNPDIMFD